MTEALWHIWVIKQNRINMLTKFLEDNKDIIVESLYPTVTQEYKASNGSFRKRKVPLYSGYFFMKYIPTNQNHHLINSQKFVTTYVGRCSGADLELVKKYKENEVINNSKSFKLDDIVKVNGGPFKGFEGSVVAINPTSLVVIIQVFGRDVKTSFYKDDVDIVDRNG